MCVHSVAQLCLTLPPHGGFAKQAYWRGLSFPPPENLPNPGIELMSLVSPCIVRWILYHEHHLGSPFQRAVTSEVQPSAFASVSLSESLEEDVCLEGEEDREGDSALLAY